MTTYVSSIGNGPGADWSNWASFFFEIQFDNTFTVQEGDVFIGVLQNSEEHTDASHIIQFGNIGPPSRGVNYTVIMSGTNPLDRDPFAEPYCDIDNFRYLTCDENVVRYEIHNIDASSDTRLRFQPGGSASDTGIDAYFTNCRFYKSNNLFMEDFTGNSPGRGSRSTLPFVNITFSGCMIEPLGNRFIRQHPTSPTSSVEWYNTTVNLIGCSIYQRNGGTFIDQRGRDESRLQVNASGSLFASTGANPLVAINTPSAYTDGVTVDFITREDVDVLAEWSTAGSQTNVSSNVTFVFGTAPSPGEVAYASSIPSTGFVELNLYDSDDNLAKGFVTNVTQPSPTLIGTDRGTSPFDAGAFEFVDAGGADVTAAFGNVYVNLY